MTVVHVGRDDLTPLVTGSERFVAVLTQPGAHHISERVAALAEEHDVPAAVNVLPDRDDAKRLEVVERCVEWLAGAGLRRDGVIVGVGGGALTDVTGFVAAIYMRGVEARYLPTTLLGAVDAAIGGKTAVNIGGKNLAGTFTHPSVVVVDLEVLDALDVELKREGMVEALKAGIIADPALLELIEVGGVDADLEQVVRRSTAVKIGIVEEDFREAGRRAVLNFGHTIGHAVETVAAWSHGASVAVGMVAAAEISSRTRGFSAASRITDAIERLGMPTAAAGIDADAVRAALSVDKKSDADGLRMVLLDDIGVPMVTHVDSTTLDVGLRAIGLT